MSKRSLLDRCMDLEWKQLLHLFSQLLREDPERLDTPARALREKARQGEMPPEAILPLIACLMGSEDTQVIADVAKALAAYGRIATMASSVLIDKIQNMVISDDVDFWAFDGCLHSLGYIGRPEAMEVLDELEKRMPVSRAGDLFRGQMTIADREGLFLDSLKDVRARLLAEEGGTWTCKVTEWTSEQQAKGKALPAWMASVT